MIGSVGERRFVVEIIDNFQISQPSADGQKLVVVAVISTKAHFVVLDESYGGKWALRNAVKNGMKKASLKETYYERAEDLFKVLWKLK